MKRRQITYMKWIGFVRESIKTVVDKIILIDIRVEIFNRKNIRLEICLCPNDDTTLGQEKFEDIVNQIFKLTGMTPAAIQGGNVIGDERINITYHLKNERRKTNNTDFAVMKVLEIFRLITVPGSKPGPIEVQQRTEFINTDGKSIPFGEYLVQKHYPNG